MKTRATRLPRGLLVSVRSVEEAAAAVAGGAAIVDVKEPLAGALGRAPADVTVGIAVAAGCDATLTIAGGELRDGVGTIAAHLGDVLGRLGGGAARPAAVKAGSAGLDLSAWREAQESLAELIPAGIAPVAVAYADTAAARSPMVESIIRMAAELGVKTVLVDTFDKSGPGLFQVASADQVAAWNDLALGLRVVLAVAGRLTLEDVATAGRIGVGVVGVRSAACVGGRMGRVEPGHVARLVATLAAGGRMPAAVTSGEFA